MVPVIKDAYRHSHLVLNILFVTQFSVHEPHDLMVLCR